MTTDNEITELLNRSAELRRRLSEAESADAQALAYHQSALRAKLEQIAGPLWAVMSSNREVTESYLFHPDPKCRWVALSLLSTYWGLTELNATECQRLVEVDPDPDVRKAALSCLGVFYQHTNDLSIGGMLAAIVSNEAEHLATRQMAYFALLLVAGVPVDRWPCPSATHLPECVDWDLVTRFRHSQQT